MRRVSVFVKGRVQGVTFRASTRRKAKELGLTGWVKNMPDGSVGIVAEGDDKHISEFLNWCERGPSSANVESVDVNDEEYKDSFETFEIRY